MKRKNKKKALVFLFFCLVFCGLWFLFSFLEQRLVPPLQEISHMQCKAYANGIIDSAAAEALEEIDLSEAIVAHNGAEGAEYAADTALINRFCARFSERLTEGVAKLPLERIEIPLGAVTEFSLLSNLGPDIPFTLVPMGAAKVDYATAFRSVGINQVNYQIWLDISMEVKIVNPLYREQVTLRRKLMLADVVFSGKVPEQYFQMTQPDEYLLTE